jgi:hypothetical protein
MSKESLLQETSIKWIYLEIHYSLICIDILENSSSVGVSLGFYLLKWSMNRLSSSLFFRQYLNWG